MEKRRDDVCGCGGSGRPRELRHLIDVLERQQEQKVIDPSTEDTGEWPVLKPEPDTRPTPQGEGGCA